MAPQRRAAVPSWPNWRAYASVCDRKDEHPLHVPGHGHEAPLAADMIEPAEQELAERDRRLDNAEHRLGRLLAQTVQLLALERLEVMGHG